MPGMTPLGITYPCSGDTIDPTVFRVYADTTQIAISTVGDLAQTALLPVAVQANRIGGAQIQNVNAGVSTALSYLNKPYDSSTAGLLYVPPATTFTVQDPGTYLINVQAEDLSPPASWTSTRVAIVVSGIEVAAAKSDAGSVADQSNYRVNTSYLALGLPFGTIISFNFLYTGAASPMGLIGYASLIRVAIP